MEEGLFETLVTSGLSARLDQLAADLKASMQSVDKADQPEVLARHLRDALMRAIASKRTDTERVQLVNDVLDLLDPAEDPVAEPPSQLTRLSRPAAPGVVAMADVRPRTPLPDAALLTNSPWEPSLGSELRAEIETSDGVDLLCAFVKWHGPRMPEPQLARLQGRTVPLSGDHNQGEAPRALPGRSRHRAAEHVPRPRSGEVP
ncbi:hypothetical protein [Actinopolymorpha pittospori]